MELVGATTRRSRPSLGAPRKYKTRLSMYDVAPALEISIEDFETFAVDRLQVLRAIETAKVRNKKDDELTAAIRQAEEACLPLHSNRKSDAAVLDEQRRKDHISHFILRLAFCRTEDLRRWFLSQECALFKYRFETERPEDADQFLQENNLGFEPIGAEEKERLRAELSAGSPQLKGVTSGAFYKVPFEDALELVQARRVYLRGGYAYVPSTDVITLVMGVFRARLSAALTHASKVLPHMEEDERLLPILQNIGRLNSGPDYTAHAVEGLTADAIDSLVDHFPLCMRHLHESLRADGHLKHNGRNQYGLFLKGLGLSMQEALVFWRRAFQAKIPEDKFNKSYAYNIRYNYGQEGKRADFAPYSCMRIIMNNPPGPGDHHGCPFRHFSPENLRAKLKALNVADSHVAEILDLVKNMHYQIACTRLYEVTHKVEGEVPIITQPNAYADMSMGRTAPNGAPAAAGAAGGDAGPPMSPARAQSQGTAGSAGGSPAPAVPVASSA